MRNRLAALVVALLGCDPVKAIEYDGGGAPDASVGLPDAAGIDAACLGNGCGGCATVVPRGTPCDSADDLDTCAEDSYECMGTDLTACTLAGDDLDGDGYSPGPFSCAGDCDDTRAQVSPAEAEICANTIDDDCDTVIDEDCT